MPRRPATFTKADLERALAVAREYGMTVEVTRDGTFRLVPMPEPKPDQVDAVREFSL